MATNNRDINSIIHSIYRSIDRMEKDRIQPNPQKSKEKALLEKIEMLEKKLFRNKNNINFLTICNNVLVNMITNDISPDEVGELMKKDDFHFGIIGHEDVNFSRTELIDKAVFEVKNDLGLSQEGFK